MINILLQIRVDKYTNKCQPQNTYFVPQDKGTFLCPFRSLYFTLSLSVLEKGPHGPELFLRGSEIEFASTTTCEEGLPETDYVSGRMSRI